MPKVKTKKAAQKRVRITATGLLTRRNAFRSHNLEKKSEDTKRNYVKNRPVAKVDMPRVKRMLGLK